MMKMVITGTTYVVQGSTLAISIQNVTFSQYTRTLFFHFSDVEMEVQNTKEIF